MKKKEIKCSSPSPKIPSSEDPLSTEILSILKNNSEKINLKVTASDLLQMDKETKSLLLQDIKEILENVFLLPTLTQHHQPKRNRNYDILY